MKLCDAIDKLLDKEHNFLYRGIAFRTSNWQHCFWVDNFARPVTLKNFDMLKHNCLATEKQFRSADILADDWEVE